MRAGFGERRGVDGRGLGGGVVGCCFHLLVDNYCMLLFLTEIAFQRYEYIIQEVDFTN